eukprot:3357312-Pleurochrysis_carterae.AAC.1
MSDAWTTAMALTLGIVKFAALDALEHRAAQGSAHPRTWRTSSTRLNMSVLFVATAASVRHLLLVRGTTTEVPLLSHSVSLASKDRQSKRDV